MDKTQKRVFAIAIIGGMSFSCCVVFYVSGGEITPLKIPAILWGILTNLPEFLEIFK